MLGKLKNVRKCQMMLETTECSHSNKSHGWVDRIPASRAEGPGSIPGWAPLKSNCLWYPELAYCGNIQKCEKKIRKRRKILDNVRNIEKHRKKLDKVGKCQIMLERLQWEKVKKRQKMLENVGKCRKCQMMIETSNNGR